MKLPGGWFYVHSTTRLTFEEKLFLETFFSWPKISPEDEISSNGEVNNILFDPLRKAFLSHVYIITLLQIVLIQNIRFRAAFQQKKITHQENTILGIKCVLRYSCWKSLKVFRLKAAILGLWFVNLVMFNCS